MNLALNKTGVAYITNKSGAIRAQGDVGVIGSAFATSFTTTTVSAYTNGLIVVVLDPGGLRLTQLGWLPCMAMFQR